MRQFNLSSPNGTLVLCDASNLDAWLENELTAIKSEPMRTVVQSVCKRLEDFISWPAEALLFWNGCDRIPEQGKRAKYHKYPTELKKALKPFDDWDTRPNGPAIAAFLLATGVRHSRFGSSNAWSIHHIYSGKFPYQKGGATTHAAKNGLHFTQSAGLIAAHPIADALCDEFPFFTWLLRAESFKRFGYDPDKVFGKDHDQFGFVPPHTCRRIWRENAHGGQDGAGVAAELTS